MDDSPGSSKIKLKDEFNKMEREETIEDTSKNNESRENTKKNIIFEIPKNSSSINTREPKRNSLNFLSGMKPVDEILKSFVNLNIANRVDDNGSDMKRLISPNTKGKQKAYINSDTLHRLQNLDLDSDDYSDSDDAQQDANNKINDSDDDSEEYSEDKEFINFNDSQFSRVLDKFVISDGECIDLETKLEKNVIKILNYFSRKFITDAMAEEREIEMEKLPSFIYEVAGVNPKKYTDFEKRFFEKMTVSADIIKESLTKFYQQMPDTENNSMKKSSEVENDDKIDNITNTFDHLKEVIKRGEVNEFKSYINNVDRNNTIYFSKTLICAILLSCECNENHIFDHLLQELFKLKEMHRKYLAFCHALYMNDVDLLDKIYYYYSGNLHWLGTEATNIKHYQHNIVWNLKLLHILLCNARTNNTEYNKETLYYIDSLVNFNSFQVTLYTNLALSRRHFLNSDNDSNKNIIQIKALKDIVLNILKIYKFYVNEKEIKEIHIQVPIWMRDVLEDNALNFSYVDNLVRELYFKRIDLNVCLILLDNLNLLEERLLMYDGSYKKVKSRLYHFIYHLSKDWNTFVTDKKESLKISCNIDNGQSEEMVYELDLIKLSISPLIYLERKELYNCLNEFKDELEKIDINSNVRDHSNKTSKDAHSLNIVPYVTDEVSLEKILYYLDGLSYVDLKKERKYGQLIIMRIIQVLGELVKDSEESAHLSIETELFLQTEVPLHTLKLLKKIRNNITHVDAAQLVAKIDVEQNENNYKLLNDVLIELKEIKRRILKFLKIHRLRAKKASIKDAINLLRRRLNIIFKFKDESQLKVHETEENGYFKQTWRKNVSSEQFLEEAKFLEGNLGFLILSLKETTKELRDCVLMKLSVYIQTIQDRLHYIDKTHKVNSNNIDEDTQWGIIKEILRFIVRDAEIFENHPYELKRGRCSSLFEHILNMTSNEDRAENVQNMIIMIIESAEMYGFSKTSLNEIVCSYSETRHSGLAKLDKTLNRSNFLTLREQKSILNNILKIRESCEKLEDIINKNESMSKKECDTLLKNVILKNQSETLLSNLVLGKKRCLVLLECLCDRVSLLKEVLNTHFIDENKQHLIFLRNQKYQLIVEALLLDIMNIFNDNNQKKTLRKTSKFLAEVNLRNVLSHGNPLLELAGDVIDSKDLPVELMTRAIQYAQDEDSIKALTVLTRQNVDPNDIIKEDKTLSKDLQNLIIEFKKSQHWKEYLVLAVKDYNERNFDSNVKKEVNLRYQKTGPSNSSKCNTKNKELKMTTENELLKAVKAGDFEEVNRLIQTAANTNARDVSGKGCLHYAAMKGRTDMIDLLVQKSTDVRCEKDGRSALHYAAMNGHGAAARALLAAGADVTATDKRGKTPRDYATGDVMHTILGDDVDTNLT